MNLAGILGIVGVVVLVIIIIILSVALGRKSKDLKMQKQVKLDIVAQQRPNQVVRADFNPPAQQNFNQAPMSVLATQTVPPPLLPRPQAQMQSKRKPTMPEYRLKSNPAAVNNTSYSPIPAAINTPYSAIPAPNGNAGYGFLPARRNDNQYASWSNFGMQ